MNDLLEGMIAYAGEHNYNDIHLSVGDPAMIWADGVLWEYPVFIKDTRTTEMILSMVDERLMEDLKQGKDLNSVYVSKRRNQQRVNAYRQQDKLCTAVRIINNTIPTPDEPLMPGILKQLAMESRGLVLVTGPIGSGKSAILVAVVDYINKCRNCHTPTIEDPVEYVYRHKQVLIHQWEIGRDGDSFDTAFRNVMCEDPDVILVGEMRNYETIVAVVTLAETGHLVFSTLHTIKATEITDRIIDVFLSHRQEQTRMQVSGILKATITQQLLPRCDGSGRITALEAMTGTDAIGSMIRENKVHQINSITQAEMRKGMQSLNFALTRLVRNGMAIREVTEKYSDNPRESRQYLQQDPVSTVHKIRIRLINNVQVLYSSRRKR